MSVDLGAILDLAAPFVAGAIETSGTTVDILRPHPDGTLAVDPVTLDVTDTAQRIVSGAPALIVAVNAQGQPLGPGQTWQATGYRVLLLPDVTAVRRLDRVKVTDSRDPVLTGRLLVVDEVVADSPGVLRALACTRIGAG